MTSYLGILAERDAALYERHLAIAERKAALAARDMALLQRDAAIVERDSAITERNIAIAALQYQDSMIHCNKLANIADSLHHKHPPTHLAEDAYCPKEMHLTGAFSDSSIVPERCKGNEVEQRKEIDGASSMKGKRRVPYMRDQVTVASPNGWKHMQSSGAKCEDLSKKIGATMPKWMDRLDFDETDSDDPRTPVPVCSCTGVVQQCYKWGNGGWQSTCCTTTLSMYPLPQVRDKSHARVSGRKMSGSAFAKLVNRLAAEGHDLSTPLDLKDHWAKHGTNRYGVIK